MFDQTFVEATADGRKPVTVAVSLVIQATAISALIVIPLFYTDVIPATVFKKLLIAPVVRLAPIPLRPAPNTLVRSTPRLNPKAFTAPVTIPKQINQPAEAASAPDIASVVGVADASSSHDSGVIGILSSGNTAPPPPPATPVQPVKQPSGPVRYGGQVAEANLIQKVTPAYPAIAKSARVQGSVQFTALISKAGNIENLRLVRGHPLLIKAAEQAVLQWKYRPTLLNGTPVEVITDIVVNFTLAQ